MLRSQEAHVVGSVVACSITIGQTRVSYSVV